MPQYCTLAQVKLRLANKVRFTDDVNDENIMSNALALRLIAEAEGSLELDLSPRYATPIQTIAGQPFSQIGNASTIRVIVTMAELLAVIRILETDFGSGTAVDGDKYISALQKRYDSMLERLMKRRKVNGEETNQWFYPPLQNVMLGWFNTEADDGYAGRIIVTGSERGGFPADQINSPSENFWNGTIDDLPCGDV